MASAIAADRSAQRLANAGSVRSRRDTSSWRAEPAGRVAVAAAGPVEQVAHHLDQAVAGDGLDHRGGVVLGHRQEQRLLVAKMVENRAPGQAGRVLEPPHGGTLVAEPREAVARRREDLVAAGVELVLAYSGHALDRVTRPFAACNPYVRLVN